MPTKMEPKNTRMLLFDEVNRGMPQDFPELSKETLLLYPDDFKHDVVEWNGEFYGMQAIWELAKEETPFSMPLAGLATVEMWDDIKEPAELFYHIKRVLEAGDEPVILGTDGVLLDGGHRVARAMLYGQTHLNAVRLSRMPVAIGEE